MFIKKRLEDLAVFGGDSLFATPKSTSNLLQPSFENFLKYSKNIFKERQYTNNGPNVKLLEKRLSSFHETDFCVTFSSGMWAMVLAISALAIQGNTEIIMPSLTYRRMDDIASWAGLKPHFCEVDPKTLAMNAETVEPCINENTALILGAHPIVNCCDIKGLIELSNRHKIPLLFDSVESVYESTSMGKVGQFGNAEAFSLHACKFLNGFGGGYITTNDEKLSEHLKAVRSFGFVGFDNVAIYGGMNAKLNEIHAAMALASLDGVKEQVFLNRERYLAYMRLLADLPGIRLLKFDDDYQVGYKNIVVEILSDWPLSRLDTLNILNSENILARAHYYPPLHRKRSKYMNSCDGLSQTDILAEKFMNLPCGQLVDLNDINKIVEILYFIYSNADAITNRILREFT